MNVRVSKVVSRGLLALAFLVMGATLLIALTTFPRQVPGQIVVVPSERTESVEHAAERLRRNPEAETDPSLGDAPAVWNELEEHRAGGATFTADVWDPFIWISLVVILLWVGTGALIVGRQPRNAAGWIFVIIGLGFLIEIFANALVVKGVKVDPGSVPLLDLWAMVAEYALLPIGLLPLLFLLYPDGRPPTPRWRWAGRALFLGLAVAAIGFVLTPGPLNNLADAGIVYFNPTGLPALADVAGGITAVGAVTALVASFLTILAVRGRFRRSRGEERQQLRWLVFVATLAGVLFLILFGLGAVISDGWRVFGVDFFDAMFILLALVLTLGIPAAYLIAIFKHGLWGLDVVIRKTVQYAVLVAAFTLLAVLVLLAIPALVLGTGSDISPVPVLVLAALLALAFTWIRGPARALANRIVYGKRATPYEVLSEFSDNVGETYSAEDVVPRMAGLLGEATGARVARVWLRLGSEFRPAAAWPADAEARGPVRAAADELPDFDLEVAFEVRHQGDLLGALTLAMPPNDPMNPTKERLARDLAGQAGLVLRNARLIEELRASRQRLVVAQDEERRRIERNIHDGAQQELVALGVQLGLAQKLASDAAPKVAELLDRLREQATGALDNLRDLARGIYPPLLADQGLATALSAQIRKAPVPVDLEADDIGRYRQEVEAAVYFSTLEALQNVAKYAKASTATVKLWARDSTLSFSVTDDGVGFDPSSTDYGTGLQGIDDRLAALGGEVQVRSRPGSGTSILGWVPIV